MTVVEDAPTSGDEPIRLVIFGRQGAGKGTQCANLVARFGVAHISTGDMLRAAMAAGTEMGLKAKAIVDSGGLVGDDVMIPLVAERLQEADASTAGFVLDGFPRTVVQAEGLLEILGDDKLAAAVNLEVAVDIVTERMKSRARVDDTDEGIAKRLGLYESETRPVLDFFAAEGLLREVDGLGTEEEVRSRLFATVDSAMSLM